MPRPVSSSRHPDAIDLIEVGHTILHELTHIDALASAAGLTAPDDGEDAGRHGTGDYQIGCELSGARDYLTASNADPDLPTPGYNAESYAAAATGKPQRCLHCDLPEGILTNF